MNKRIIIPVLMSAFISGGYAMYHSSQPQTSSLLTIANLEAISQSETGVKFVKDVTETIQDPDTGKIKESSYRICLGTGDLPC